jgi:hypothetical protein
MRAYEIYRQRGGRPGDPTEDWVRAESEVLAYVTEEETRRAAKSGEPGVLEQARSEEPIAPLMEEERAEGPRTFEALHASEIADRAGEADAQTSEERAESQGILSTWSPSEPASAARAPGLGQATEKAIEKTRTGKAGPGEGGPATEGAKKKMGSKAGGSKKSSIKEGAPKRSGGSKGKRSKDK